MTIDEFTDSLIGMGHVATASGLCTQHQCFALLLAALTIADRESKGGITRNKFQQMAGLVYDKLRSSLMTGTKA